MGYFDRLWSATMAGYKAFQASMMGTDLLVSDSFETFESRKLRYTILWAMYENTAYDKMQKWATSYKASYGLYKYIRNIYNPSYRLGEFWRAHLLGGPLDLNAGDGSEVPSALPIVTKDETLRAAISQVWRWSNWQFKKDILGLWGPIFGDGVLKVNDRPDKGKVYLQVVHPGKLKEVDMDEWGNVKAYTIEERRPDPRSGRGGSFVTYREVATRDGDSVVYSTYMDNQLYAWNEDQGAEWYEDYGFVPLVVFQHNSVGLDFGLSELFPGMSKFREVDDLASKLHDQIRKIVGAPMLMAGVTAPKKKVKVEGEAASDEKPEPGREELPFIYTEKENAKAIPIVADLNIADTSAAIESLLKVIESEFPELSDNLHNVQGDISGRALRINRAPAEAKVRQRRPNYYDAIVRAQMMAVSIGGMRGYFQGYDLDSFAAGKLEHTIGDSPVFDTDPQDKIDEETAFWGAAKAAKDAGVPLIAYLEMQGWTKEKIAKITDSPEYQARVASLNALSEGTSSLPNNLPNARTNQNGNGA